MTNPTDIIVFAGPSLNRTEAQKILPEALYLPPVACGQIIQATRLQPKVIIIIDGFYETQASVWHKEILYALSLGIQVYGAASMGAMRAAELECFGMKGVGDVFEYFKSAELSDDAEVAVLHLNDTINYQPVTEAMVSLRFNLKNACAAGVIASKSANTIAEVAQKIFYQHRTLDKLKHHCQLCETIDKTQLDNFFNWYQTHKTDIKQADALKALQKAKQAKLEPANLKPLFRPTSFFHSLYHEMQTQAFYTDHVALPEHEKALLRLKDANQYYNCAVFFAGFLPALSVIMDINAFKNLSFSKSTDLESLTPFIEDYLKLTNTLDTDPKEDLPRYHFILLIAKAWQQLDTYLTEKNFITQQGTIEQYFQAFIQTYEIDSEEAFLKFLEKNRWSEATFVEFIERMARYDHVVKGCNFDWLEMPPDLSHCPQWLTLACEIFHEFTKGQFRTVI